MARRRRQRRKQADRAYLVLVVLVVAAVLAWTIAYQHRRIFVARPKLSPAQARVFNAHIPFVANRGQPATPFHFRGTPAARLQAEQCLATAALYEAGTDRSDQEAVIQVVLNRVRLPRYPQTICGVVYQGSTLATGCQFSFSCDGSRTRRTEYRGWDAARRAARRALSGYVDPAVGRATHYHADWIVPYWIGSLDKIAQVHGHIFYRPKAPEIGLDAVAAP